MSDSSSVEHSGFSRIRSSYGAGPLHLLLVLASLAVGLYVVVTLGVSNLWDPDVWWQSIAVWFAGAIIAHDLIVFPLYALVDRGLSKGRRRQGGSSSAVNYIRIPLIANALLFAVFFPGIIGQGAGSYMRATGQTQDPFLVRWLILAGVIFALSAVAYGVRRITTPR